MRESYLAKFAIKNNDEDFIKQLVLDTRKEERKHCANLYSIHLVKLASQVLNQELGFSASAALMQLEAENIERQAQEWNYV